MADSTNFLPAERGGYVFLYVYHAMWDAVSSLLSRALSFLCETGVDRRFAVWYGCAAER